MRLRVESQFLSKLVENRLEALSSYETDKIVSLCPNAKIRFGKALKGEGNAFYTGKSNLKSDDYFNIDEEDEPEPELFYYA